jgi:hypothetical protein
MLQALKVNKFFQICNNVLLEGTILFEEVMVCDDEPLKTGTMLKYVVLFESSQASTACPFVKKNAGTGRVWNIGGIVLTG